MKKSTLLLLVLLLFNNAADSTSRYTWECFMSFEFPISCGADTLHIDTVSNPNNCWEIGTPNKATFDSAYNSAKAILTKLNTTYPVNDTSSFIISHQADYALDLFGYMWINAYYKIDSDTLTDCGTVEFSPDNGNTWIDLLQDTTYYQMGLYRWYPYKPVFSGRQPGWQIFDLQINDINHVFNIHLGDTVLFKFTFISDSVQTFKDGWMFDNIDVNDWWEGIADVNKLNSHLTIFPNPVSSQTIIKSDIVLKNASLDIYDVCGKKVDELNNLSGNTVLYKRHNLSKGIYFIQITEKNILIATDKFIVED